MESTVRLVLPFILSIYHQLENGKKHTSNILFVLLMLDFDVSMFVKLMFPYTLYIVRIMKIIVSLLQKDVPIAIST